MVLSMEDMMTGGQSPLEAVETATTLTRPPPTTVVSSDVDVSNGFVKNGTSLPYIIETNKSGESRNLQGTIWNKKLI